MAEGELMVRRIFNPEEKSANEEGLLRVAAYCRVSTKREEQLSSFETQLAVYRDRIENEPGWVLAGIYADHGLSGVRAEKRPQFQQMIKDCEDGKIDLLITKSISRFGRNTLDTVKYIQKLRSIGIRLIFEKENIDTDSAYSDMLLTVLAAFAQEESHSHSENVKWAKRKRAMSGKPSLYPPYGYRKSEDGTTMVIDPEEAKVVRWIFEQYEHGASIMQIRKELIANGTPEPRIDDNRTGIWEDSRIWMMLKNVKYMGDIHTHRRYTPDFLTGKEEINFGAVPRFYYFGHHEAIISEKQFNRCGDILLMKTTRRFTPVQYPYSDYLKCPYCGHLLHTKRTRAGKKPWLFCEGEGACREFVIERPSVDNAILSAYASLELKGLDDSEGAELLRKIRAEYPSFQTIEYWWLDDLIQQIEFGQHTYSPTELSAMPEEIRLQKDDSNLIITWRCGITQTVSTGITEDKFFPRNMAARWDAFAMEREGVYPKEAAEARAKKERELSDG